MNTPELPYDDGKERTSGWSGSETSHHRAVDADTSGVTGQRQADALRALNARGGSGLTYKELGQWLDLHHGQSSGVLSVLHKAGRIARLHATRDKCKVYVLPRYVGERAIDEAGSVSTSKMLTEMYVLLSQCMAPDVWQGLQHYIPDGPEHMTSEQWQDRAWDVLRHYEAREGEVTNDQVIDIFTKKPVTPEPDHGFEGADHYCEWVRQEAVYDLILLAETMRDGAWTVADVTAGLKAMRRQIKSMKPPANLA